MGSGESAALRAAVVATHPPEASSLGGDVLNSSELLLSCVFCDGLLEGSTEPQLAEP